jgi:hypothetical protein
MTALVNRASRISPHRIPVRAALLAGPRPKRLRDECAQPLVHCAFVSPVMPVQDRVALRQSER